MYAECVEVLLYGFRCCVVKALSDTAERINKCAGELVVSPIEILQHSRYAVCGVTDSAIRLI